MNDTSRETAAATAANETTPEHHNGSTNGHAADTLGDVYVRLADAVTVVGASRNGALKIDRWSDGPDKAEIDEEEVEKEPVPLEEQEGIDDPVRMYLREIGKVH